MFEIDQKARRLSDKQISSFVNYTKKKFKPKVTDVDLDKLPILKRLYSVIPKKRIYEAIIGGGEDYELCFTINKRYRDKLKEISHKFNIPLTRIGSITSGEINYYSKNSLVKLNITGFDHFCK